MKNDSGYLHINSVRAKIAFVFSIFFFFQGAVFCYAAESNFWKERRNSLKGRQDASSRLQKNLLAQLLITQAVPQWREDFRHSRESGNPGLTSGLKSVSENWIPAFAGMTDVPFAGMTDVPFAGMTGVPSWIYEVVSPYATIQGIQLSKNPKAKTVLLLQDAHLHFEAQTHIADSIKALSRALKDHSSYLLVGLEGADIPEADYSLYTQIPERKALGEVAKAMLKYNLINGVELAAIGYEENGTEGPVTLPFKVTGVENKIEYDANVSALRDSVPYKDHVLKALSDFKRSLIDQKNKSYSENLKVFDAKLTSYQEGKTSLPEYVQFLSSIRSAQTPQVKALMEAFALEKSLDFGKVEAERTKVLNKLMGTLSDRDLKTLLQFSVAFRSGQMKFAEYYEFLKNLCYQKGISWAKFPAFDGYVQYVLKSEAIDAQGLLSEIPEFEKKVEAALIQDEKERELCELTRDFHLLSKLTKHSLTEPEWKVFESRREDIRRIFERFSLLILSPRWGERIWEEGGFASFEKFYVQAVKRNKTIAEKMASRLAASDTDTGLLVVGGFHTQGVLHGLKEKGFSIVSLSPKITKVDENALTSLDILAEGRLPLDRLFAGERLFLPVAPVASDPGAVGPQATLEVADFAQALTREYYDPTRDGTSDDGLARAEENPKGKIVIGGRTFAFSLRKHPLRHSWRKRTANTFFEVISALAVMSMVVLTSLAVFGALPAIWAVIPIFVTAVLIAIRLFIQKQDGRKDTFGFEDLRPIPLWTQDPGASVPDDINEEPKEKFPTALKIGIPLMLVFFYLMAQPWFLQGLVILGAILFAFLPWLGEALHIHLFWNKWIARKKERKKDGQEGQDSQPGGDSRKGPSLSNFSKFFLIGVIVFSVLVFGNVAQAAGGFFTDTLNHLGNPVPVQPVDPTSISADPLAKAGDGFLILNKSQAALLMTGLVFVLWQVFRLIGSHTRQNFSSRNKVGLGFFPYVAFLIISALIFYLSGFVFGFSPKAVLSSLFGAAFVGIALNPKSNLNPYESPKTEGKNKKPFPYGDFIQKGLLLVIPLFVYIVGGISGWYKFLGLGMGPVFLGGFICFLFFCVVANIEAVISKITQNSDKKRYPLLSSLLQSLEMFLLLVLLLSGGNFTVQLIVSLFPPIFRYFSQILFGVVLIGMAMDRSVWKKITALWGKIPELLKGLMGVREERERGPEVTQLIDPDELDDTDLNALRDVLIGKEGLTLSSSMAEAIWKEVQKISNRIDSKSPLEMMLRGVMQSISSLIDDKAEKDPDGILLNIQVRDYAVGLYAYLYDNREKVDEWLRSPSATTILSEFFRYCLTSFKVEPAGEASRPNPELGAEAMSEGAEQFFYGAATLAGFLVAYFFMAGGVSLFLSSLFGLGAGLGTSLLLLPLFLLIHKSVIASHPEHFLPEGTRNIKAILLYLGYLTGRHFMFAGTTLLPALLLNWCGMEVLNLLSPSLGGAFMEANLLFRNIPMALVWFIYGQWAGYAVHVKNNKSWKWRGVLGASTVDPEEISRPARTYLYPAGGFEVTVKNPNRNYVQTSKGAVSIGMSMLQRPLNPEKEKYPGIIIAPSGSWVGKDGTNLMQIYFSIAANFFFHSRKTEIVCTREQKGRILEYLRLGNPYGLPNIAGYDQNKMRRFTREAIYLADRTTKKISPSGEIHQTSAPRMLAPADKDDEEDENEYGMFRFKILDEGGIAHVQGLEVQALPDGRFQIQDGENISILNTPEQELEVDFAGVSPLGTRPEFGFTSLGQSSGMDSNGLSSSHVIWAGEFSFIVDLGAATVDILKALQVTPKDISHVVITHMHEDHVAGALRYFHWVQENKQPIRLVMEPGIYEHFRKQARQILGQDLESVYNIELIPLKFNEPRAFGQGERAVLFEPIPVFHGTPTLGFRLTYRGRTITHSSDTALDVRRFKEIVANIMPDHIRRDLNATPYLMEGEAVFDQDRADELTSAFFAPNRSGNLPDLVNFEIGAPAAGLENNETNHTSPLQLQNLPKGIAAEVQRNIRGHHAAKLPDGQFSYRLSRPLETFVVPSSRFEALSQSDSRLPASRTWLIFEQIIDFSWPSLVLSAVGLIFSIQFPATHPFFHALLVSSIGFLLALRFIGSEDRARKFAYGHEKWFKAAGNGLTGYLSWLEKQFYLYRYTTVISNAVILPVAHVLAVQTGLWSMFAVSVAVAFLMAQVVSLLVHVVRNIWWPWTYEKPDGTVVHLPASRNPAGDTGIGKKLLSLLLPIAFVVLFGGAAWSPAWWIAAVSLVAGLGIVALASWYARRGEQVAAGQLQRVQTEIARLRQEVSAKKEALVVEQGGLGAQANSILREQWYFLVTNLPLLVFWVGVSFVPFNWVISLDVWKAIAFVSIAVLGAAGGTVILLSSLDLHFAASHKKLIEARPDLFTKMRRLPLLTDVISDRRTFALGLPLIKEPVREENREAIDSYQKYLLDRFHWFFAVPAGIFLAGSLIFWIGWGFTPQSVSLASKLIFTGGLFVASQLAGLLAHWINNRWFKWKDESGRPQLGASLEQDPLVDKRVGIPAQPEEGQDTNRDAIERTIQVLNQSGPLLARLFPNPNSTYSLGGFKFANGKMLPESEGEARRLLASPDASDKNAQTVRRFAKALETTDVKWVGKNSKGNLQEAFDVQEKTLGIVDLPSLGMDLDVVWDIFMRTNQMPAVLMTEKEFKRLLEHPNPSNMGTVKAITALWSHGRKPIFLTDEKLAAPGVPLENLIQNILSQVSNSPSSVLLFSNRDLDARALQRFFAQVIISLVQVFSVEIEEGGVGGKVEKSRIYAKMA